MSAPVPIGITILIILFVIYKMWKPKPVSRGNSSLVAREKANFEVMEEIVARYEGYTAEVINFAVRGVENVTYWRTVPIGTALEIKKDGIDYFVYAGGRRVGSFLKGEGSNIERLFDDRITFDAYLGGRDASVVDTLYDCASIILFYKIEGVPPTKVNLEGKDPDRCSPRFTPTRRYHTSSRIKPLPWFDPRRQKHRDSNHW